MALIRLTDIQKRFGETLALDRVSFTLEEGEIHALLGENGAGKTTLMNVLYGLVRPDAGRMEMDGRPVAFASPAEAIRAGIGMVHQHFMLIPNLTVAENILLGARERNPFWFRRRSALRETTRLAQEFGLDVAPARLVGELPPGVQQRVEILKCLARRARVLVLDEPTAVLAPQEVAELITTLRRLRDAGRSVIFISHKLREVLTLCDRVTVLRLGRNVGTVSVAEANAHSLSEMMVGRAVMDTRRERARRGSPAARSEAATEEERREDEGDPVLELERLTVLGATGRVFVRELSLRVRRGEVYGVAGIDGNGQQELMEALAGVRPTAGGRMLLEGEDITGRSARARAEMGLALITDDRQRKGLILDFSVAENLALKTYRQRPFARRGFLDLRAVEAFARELADEYDVRAPGVRSWAGTLSGGNQQKAVVAREMRHARRALVAVNPTRGLDVGATEYVHRVLLSARDAGLAVLLLSTELDEVLQVSDRVGVMYDGNIRQVPADSVDRALIGRWMVGQG
jgi:simple sugar transport system ATP-binding protein